MERHPVQLSRQQLEDVDWTNISSIKRLDCAMYNACMTEARDGNWRNFTCNECKAFEIMEPEQRAQDLFQLLGARAAAKNEEETGCAGRKRGVRPGADAKVRRRLALVPMNKTDDPPTAEPIKTTA